MQAICEAVGPGRAAIRLAPVTPVNDASDPQPQALFEHVVRELARMDLAYLHLIEGATGSGARLRAGRSPVRLRRAAPGLAFGRYAAAPGW